MKNIIEHINLKGVIDYLIFSRKAVNINDNNEPARSIKAQIIDHVDNSITISCDENISASCHIGQSYVISTEYKSKLLSFPVMLTELEGNNCSVEVPLQGTLIERRSYNRAKLGENNFDTTVLVDSTHESIEFNSAILIDLSFQSLALFLDRKQGLVLPGDKVRNIIIRKNGHTIFESNGILLFVDKTKQCPEIQDSYFVVIQFLKTSIQSINFERTPRKSQRISLLNKKNAFFEFSHPMIPNCNFSGYLADLSNSGMSIILEGDSNALPPGLVIDNASLQLPLKPRFTVSVRVKNYQVFDSEENKTYRIGFEIQNMSPHLFKAISSIVQTSTSENLIDANSVDYDRLWEFFFETGFIYGGKRKQIQNYAEKVFSTYNKLLKSETTIAKKILYKEGNDIKGHVAAVKFFDHTLIIQHLNALKTKGELAAQSVIKGMTGFILDEAANAQISNRYIVAYYRPDNLYPDTLFTGSSQLIADSSICWVNTYNFCLFDDTLAEREYSDDIDLNEASQQDLEDLETLLIKLGEIKLIRQEDLTRDHLVNLSITREYEKIGLYRYRRVFIAKQKMHTACCYAICNYSSPGLNLSELTNSVRLLFSDPEHPGNAKLASALMSLVNKSYQFTDMPNMVLLLSSNQPVPYGYKVEKKYTQWTLDIFHSKMFEEASNEIFTNFKDFLRKRKRNNNPVIIEKQVG